MYCWVKLVMPKHDTQVTRTYEMFSSVKSQGSIDTLGSIKSQKKKEKAFFLISSFVILISKNS